MSSLVAANESALQNDEIADRKRCIEESELKNSAENEEYIIMIYTQNAASEIE